MALAAGTRLGPYEIAAQIGEGGMGEVYQATDTNLARQVAIKVLPASVASDPERLARFDREAKTLAALNHPNIAQIHGLEKSVGTIALVMELVEGPTLADRIAQGAIPVDEALPIAKQIAEALEAAHEQGIIHRDLKPANVKVRPDGTVKVLDFGLAKALEPTGAMSPGMSQAPTITTPAMTQAGMILGTAAYMSPEQAKGRNVDKRSDVWAFGAVLFEMLSGKRAFDAEDVSETLAAVLMREPDWAALPTTTLPTVTTVLRRCLQKDRKQRARDIGDVALALEGAFETPMSQPVAQVVQVAPQSKLTWVAAVVLALVVGAASWTLKPEPPTAPLVIGRFSHVLPDDQQFALAGGLSVNLSPDGSRLVYVANQALYLRPIDTLESTLIRGMEEDPRRPFFSPDGQWIGYWSGAGNQLKKIALSGGAPVTLTDADAPIGVPHWTDDGYIVWGQVEGVLRVSENGGTPELLIEPSRAGFHANPHVLPGGRAVLFTIGLPTGADVVVHSLDTQEQKILFPGNHPIYFSTGHVVYAVDDVLFAVPFDLATLEVVGGPVPLVEGVRGAPPQFAVSQSGTLAYVLGSSAGDTRNLAVLDRQGNAELVSAPPRSYIYPRFSPDNTRVAVQINEEGGSNIWIFEMRGGVLNQLTFDGGRRPLWTPDGAAVTFQRGGAFWTVPSDFSGSPTPMPGTEVAGNEGPGSWSPDGMVLLFSSGEGIHAWRHAWRRADEAAEVIVSAPDNALIGMPEFSPDGQWFGYVTGETGGLEIYANPYPVSGGARQRITTDGGFAPVWVQGREELIYQQGGGSLQALEISTQPQLMRSNPMPLFSEQELGDLGGDFRRNFDVSTDGQRFIVVQAVGSETPQQSPRINIVLNWLEELKARVPVP